MPYQALDPHLLTSTIATLHKRIDERFPDSDLVGVCGELRRLSEKARDATDALTRPMLALRAASGALIALIVAGLAVTLMSLRSLGGGFTIPVFVQTLEAAINDLVLIGLAVFFLASVERRLKRRRVLAALSELRSVAHIIDMHQLTKDPQHVLHVVADTPTSPERSLDQASLSRYLDYCSEMLSLTGKIAALYVQRFDDGVVLAAVDEVESLTTGLSNKIWQKLMILESA